MKIESPNNSKIIVELSDEDMVKLDITYDELDYSNIDTRRVIWTILAKVRKRLGRDIDPSGKMTIETLPSKSGGCMIFFTVPQEDARQRRTLPMRIYKENFVYEFENSDDVIDFYKSMRNTDEAQLMSAELYHDEKGRYRMIFNRLPDLPSVKNRLSEFASFCGEGVIQAQFTREHWVKVQSSVFC